MIAPNGNLNILCVMALVEIMEHKKLQIGSSSNVHWYFCRNPKKKMPDTWNPWNYGQHIIKIASWKYGAASFWGFLPQITHSTHPQKR